MQIHNLRIVFLRIGLTPDNVALIEALLQKLFEVENDQLLIERTNGSLLAIPYDREGNAFHVGLAKDRQGTWPFDRKAGKLNPIDAAALAEKTHFLFLPRRRLLVVAYHGHGPSIGPLRSYLYRFRRLAKMKPQNLAFNYIFEKDVYETFLRRGIAKKITFGISLGLPNRKVISQIIGKNDWKKAIDLLCDDSDGEAAEVTVRVRRAENWLNSNFVARVIKHFRASESAEKLTAKGTLSDLTVRDFDLLGPKPLREKLRIVSEDRYPLPEQIRTEMCKSLERFKDYLPGEEKA